MWENTLWRGIWPTSSVQLLIHVWLFTIPWNAARHASLSITNFRSLLKLISIELVMPSNHLIFCCSFLLLPSNFPASGSFQMSQLFASRGQTVGVTASTSDLPMSTQDWFSLGWTGWIPLHPRDSQESSPTPQFKNINSSVLTVLYSPTLTSIHDYWKNRPICGILPRDNLKLPMIMKHKDGSDHVHLWEVVKQSM